MAYRKAVAGALLAGLLLGLGFGAARISMEALARLRPEDKAKILSFGISEAANCAAFFILVLVPLAVVLVFFFRWWQARSAVARAARRS